MMEKKGMRTSGPPGKNDQFDLDKYLFFWIGQIDGLYARGVTRALRSLRVNLTTWRTLAVLETVGSMTITELSEFTAIERSTLSRATETMEQRGLVKRFAHASDKRMHDLEITPEGSELLAKIIPVIQGWSARVTHDVDAKDLAITIKTLKKVRANFFSP